MPLELPREITAKIISREKAIVSGTNFAKQIFSLKNCKTKIVKKDGMKVQKNQVILQVSGDVRAILSCERTALNLLSRMSGITTKTNIAVMPKPNTIVAAIGIKNCACRDFSNIRADKPPIVVSDVSKTGLNLFITPDITACLKISKLIVFPFINSSNLLSIVETNIIELFTTIPARANNANIERIDIVKFKK